MSADEAQGQYLRAERAEVSRLAWAFGISLALHLLIGGGYQAGRKLGWWQHWEPPAWMQQAARALPKILTKKDAQRAEPPKVVQKQLPLIFVDVSPDQVAAEPPKETKYYSDKSSRAANPTADKESTIPKIDGQQTHVVRTEDVPRAKTFPLQPSAPAEPAKQTQEEVKEVKPKTPPPPGDLAMAKPQPQPQPIQVPAPEQSEPTHARPRTIQQALALPQNSRLAGERMKQEGGVHTRAIKSSLDVLSTKFGAYDAAIIAAVQNCWFDLLESQGFARDGIGKVTVQFHLNSDGSVSEVSLAEYTVDYALAQLCVRAIRDPGPYAPWPTEMRNQVGENHRDVTFTFFYE